MRTDCSTPARQIGDAHVREPLDLRREAGQRVARDVEAERLLLALQLFVERPLGEVREVVGRRAVVRGAAAEEARLAELDLLPDPRGLREHPLRRRGERRPVLARASRTLRRRSARRSHAC